MPTFTFTAPTSDDIYAMSKAKWRQLGITASTDLDNYVLQATAYVIEMTGRYFSDWPAPVYEEDGGAALDIYGFAMSAGAALPISGTPVKAPLMIQAVRMRTEQLVFQAQEGYLDTVTDDAIQSFSAGPYSETRGDASRRGEEKTLNAWRGLNDLLWTLMTEDRYSFWLSFITGAHTPAFAVEEVAWDLIGKDYGIGRIGSGNVPYWNN